MRAEQISTIFASSGDQPATGPQAPLTVHP